MPPTVKKVWPMNCYIAGSSNACREITGKLLIDMLQRTPQARVSKKKMKARSGKEKENRDKLTEVKQPYTKKSG